ncbi:MAG: TonB-dependent receptor [Comamonadaceae bacterium]|nr:TonB-dependent receptor [Comamonadaceae bacterium]
MTFAAMGLERRKLAVAVWMALASWGGAWAQPAIASADAGGMARQAREAEKSEKPDDAAEAAPTLPAVVITGAKREQRLEQLHGAASVAERTALEDAQAGSTLALDRVFPALHMSYSGSQLFPVITLRGVTSAQDFYNPALTVYVDGVPQLPVSSIQSLVDVERVELLKGPQGTLYGKSAQGGVLHLVTRQPGEHFEALARAGLSSRGGHQAQASAAGPLVPGLLYGAAALSVSQVPGELHSPVLGGRLGGSRAQAGQLKLRLAPAAQPWELGLHGGRDCARATQDVYTPYDAIGPRQAWALDALPAELRHPRQRRCVNTLAARGQYAWGDWQLSAVASTQRLRLTREFPFGAQYSWQPEQWRQNTQELRLSTRQAGPGQASDAPPARAWDGVLGLYRQQVRQQRHYSIENVVPARAPFLESLSRNRSQSLAAYGDFSWRVGARADLSAGLRLSRDSAATRFAGHLMGGAVAGERASGQRTWLGRLGAGWRLSPQWRGYVNFAQGYKPAGYALAPTSAADAEGFGRERSYSLEAGVRGEARDWRMQLALYRVDTRDAQLYGDSQMGYQTLKNVGDIRSTGLEFDTQWRGWRGWTLGASGFVSHAVFRRYSASTCAQCDGHRVPLAPRSGLTLSAKGRVRVGTTVLRPRVAVRYVGPHYFDAANRLRQGGYTLIDAGLAWYPARDVELSLHVHNLGNKTYRGYGFSYGPAGSFAQVGRGRSVGLSLTYAY